MFTALIVEDNRTFRHFLRDTLHERYPRIKIQEASDGESALEMVKKRLPDLIFMDIRLPGESGLEITKQIKRDYPEVPVIIITNHDLAEYREAAFRYGADFFVAKGSSTWEEITGFVESILSKRGLQDTPAGQT